MSRFAAVLVTLALVLAALPAHAVPPCKDASTVGNPRVTWVESTNLTTGECERWVTVLQTFECNDPGQNCRQFVESYRATGPTPCGTIVIPGETGGDVADPLDDSWLLLAGPTPETDAGDIGDLVTDPGDVGPIDGSTADDNGDASDVLFDDGRSVEVQ